MDAIQFIEEKLQEPLQVEELAKIAYCSPFHFQRMFHMLTGMTVAEYTRKRRLTLAAQELASAQVKVIDVALRYGYETPESFAKAFRKLHGVSPSEARDNSISLKAFPRISFQLSLRGEKEMDYRIVEKESFHVVGKSMQVSCKDGENLRLIPAFWGQCNQDGTVEQLTSLSPGKPMLGICKGMEYGKDLLTYVVGIEGEPADGYDHFEIPAAAWAVFTAIGPLPGTLQQLWQRIFQEWFPATGYEHAGGSELELYPEGGDVTADDYRCEVWIPVIKK